MNVLIIEDSKVEAQIFAQALKKVIDEPVKIHHTATLNDGVTCLVDHDDLDLVFLDLKLPDSTEWRDTYDAVAPYATKVPVIVVSGEDNKDIAREVLKNGAEDYIVKGGKKRHIDMLKETIDFALLRHQQVRELAAKAEQEELTIHWLSGGYSVDHD